MIDNNAQFVMEMQQSQSQANRSKSAAVMTSSSREQSFSGYLNESQKTYKEKGGTPENNAKNRESDKPRNVEQQAQSAVPEKPESRPINQVKNNISEKNSDGESKPAKIKDSQSTVINRSEKASTEEKAAQEAKADEEGRADTIAEVLPKELSDTDQDSVRNLTDFIKLLLQQEEKAEANISSDADNELTGDNEKLTVAQLIAKLTDEKNATSLTEGESHKLSAEELVAKIVDTRSSAGMSALMPGVEDDRQTRLLAELAKRILGEKELNVGQEGKLEKPLPAVNTANTGIKLEAASDPRLENLSTLDEKALAADTDAELLLTKFVERLDLNKINSEVMLQNKILGNKSSMMADFTDQLAAKSSSESLDRTSMLSSLGVAGRPLAATTPAVAQQLTLQTQVDNPEWGSEFSKRIQFLVKNNMQHAELRLDPPELGKIQVKINLSQDQASVAFVSQSGSVRDAIEQAMPRLREMLNESGIQLGDADVSSQFQQKNENSTEHGSKSGASSELSDYDEDGESELIPHTATEYSVDGVIDYFA